jgi:hypothetical protein
MSSSMLSMAEERLRVTRAGHYAAIHLAPDPVLRIKNPRCPT